MRYPRDRGTSENKASCKLQKAQVLKIKAELSTIKGKAVSLMRQEARSEHIPGRK